MTTPVSSASSDSGNTNILNLLENCRMAVPITGNAFFKIPTPIISDILSRLTPDEIGRCRCVCKPWLELLSESEFVNLHLSKSQTCLIVHDIPSFTLVEVVDQTNHHGVRYKAPINREIPRSSQSFSMSMTGSIDGLVCINEIESMFENDSIHVWNPSTGEFITIHTPEGDEKPQFPNVVAYGFGISSGKYHVVRIFQKIRPIPTEHIPGSTYYCSQQILDSTCHVYTLGTGFWKNIGQAPYLYSEVKHGLSLNGNLHWLVYDENGPDQMCCLDLESESFKPFPSPPELPKSPFFTSTLNVYKGCISVCGNISDGYISDFAIWVMKEYGVQNSWTKEVVISKHLIDHKSVHYEDCRILKVFEDGEILLLWRKYKLFSYHPKTKTVHHFDVEETLTGPSIDACPSFPCLFPCIEATEYVSSLVSLKKLGELNVYRA